MFSLGVKLTAGHTTENECGQLCEYIKKENT